MNTSPTVVGRFVIEKGGNRRLMGIFICHDCREEFSGRMERLHIMSGCCRACSNIRAGKKRSTHGLNNRNSRLHVTWANMKRRCLNPRGAEVEKYRGVTLCAEWMEFECFMNWSLANGYTDAMTIDRIDASKGYSPDNCRYVNYSVQSANRRITNKNTSGHVGVSFQKGKWVAKVRWMGRQMHLGRFENKEDAVKARNKHLEENSLPHTRA